MKTYDIVAVRNVKIEGTPVVSGQVLGQITVAGSMTVGTLVGGLPGWCEAMESDGSQELQPLEDSQEVDQTSEPAADPEPELIEQPEPEQQPENQEATNDVAVEYLKQSGFTEAIAKRLVANSIALDEPRLLTVQGIRDWVADGNDLADDLDDIGPKYKTMIEKVIAEPTN